MENRIELFKKVLKVTGHNMLELAEKMQDKTVVSQEEKELLKFALVETLDNSFRESILCYLIGNLAEAKHCINYVVDLMEETI